MNRSSGRCSRARPRPRPSSSSSNPSLLQKIEHEDELAWQVHGPDARPVLEVEAFHEPQDARPANQELAHLGVHGSDARPILEVEAFHEPAHPSAPNKLRRAPNTRTRAVKIVAKLFKSRQ